MTQDRDNQESIKESPSQESTSGEIPDADLEKISGGAEPANSKVPKRAEPISEGR